MSATTSDLLSNGQRYYLPVYRPRQLVLERGQGARLWDTQGREFIDLAAGIAVCSLGHNNPDLKAALFEQADKLWLFFSPAAQDIALRVYAEPCDPPTALDCIGLLAGVLAVAVAQRLPLWLHSGLKTLLDKARQQFLVARDNMHRHIPRRPLAGDIGRRLVIANQDVNRFARLGLAKISAQPLVGVIHHAQINVSR